MQRLKFERGRMQQMSTKMQQIIEWSSIGHVSIHIPLISPLIRIPSILITKLLVMVEYVQLADSHISKKGENMVFYTIFLLSSPTYYLQFELLALD